MLATRDTIAPNLKNKGWVLIEDKLTPAEFDELASTLGRTMLETPVRLTREARTYLSSPKPLPAHTDHPSVEHIAWHCLAQDDEDGASLLIDSKPILEAMGDQAEALSRVLLGCPPLKGLDPTGTWPLVTLSGSSRAVYYAPWQRPQVDDDETQAAYREFRSRVEATTPHAVRLEPGQALMIDNRRILHARGALKPDSRRELRRLWLTQAEAAG